MFEISVRTHFSAAHHLEGYGGACASLHGHNWEVEVFVSGERLNNTGILLDFRVLKDAVTELLDGLDHSDLNALDVFKGKNPTSENIAEFLHGELSRKLNSESYHISRVTIHETPGTGASYWGGPRQ